MAFVLVRNRFAFGLSALLLLASWLAPATRAQDATGLDSISAEYHVLLDLFYRPLNAQDLLQAGWMALTADATRRGVPPPAALPDLPSDADAAFGGFAGAYTTYVASLPPSFTATL